MRPSRTGSRPRREGEEAQLLPALAAWRDSHAAGPAVEDKETRPPPRYNEGTRHERTKYVHKSVEQLGERILEQRQRVRLGSHVRDQSPHEAWLDGDVELARRECRCSLQLAGAERHDGDHVLGEELPETGSARGRS